MDYIYSGPIGSSINGLAAFLSGAASYFLPISRTGVVTQTSFVSQLISLKKLDVFLETYGSISLNVEHFQLLDGDAEKVLKVFIDEGLVKVCDLSQEGTGLFETFRSRLTDEEALSLAQAVDSNVNMVVVKSEEAKILAVGLGIRPIGYEDFLLEAYKKGLADSEEIIKILL